MGLSQALSTAMSGLRATQASLALVSSNVANAETPGYVKKTLNQVAGTTGDSVPASSSTASTAQLDQYLQTPAAHRNFRRGLCRHPLDLSRQSADRLRQSGRQPARIENAFNNLLTGGAGPVDQSGLAVGAHRRRQRRAVDGAAAQRHDAGIQSLRANAETGINDSVIAANNAMTQIAAINNQLQSNGQTDASTAALLDQRDQYIDQLSQLMDIRTVTNNLNQVTRVHQFRRAAGRHRGVAS